MIFSLFSSQLTALLNSFIPGYILNETAFAMGLAPLYSSL